jgi:hypothetical protein
MKPRPERCATCGAALTQPAGAGRPRRYCGRRCQARAARRRRHAPPATIERSDPRVDYFLRECGL